MLIVEMGFRVEVTIGCAQAQILHHFIRQRHIHTTGTGIVHVFIHSGLHLRAAVAQIGGGDAGRDLPFRHIHQRNHVVQLVEIARDGHREPTAAILSVGGVVVTGLGIEVNVADVIEDAAAHHVEIAVMQLLDGGRLEALTPTQTETEVTGREHRTDLGRQTETEVAVIHQTETGSQIEPLQQVELILHVESGGPVVGGARLCAVRGIQIVVAVFKASVQRVLVREIEDTLEQAHHPLLVALQLALPGHHSYREPLAVLIAVFLADEQHIVVVLGGIVVVIGVFVPIDIQRQVIRLFTFHFSLFTPQIPFAADRCRGVVVTQIVGIDIAAGVRAVGGAEDVFLVVGAFGIEFQTVKRLIGQAFCQLPVAELVHRLVLAVCQHHPLGILLRCVLPSVVTLQLEVGLTVHLADTEGQRVVLSQAVVGAIAGDVVCIEPLLGMLLGDDVDDAGHRIAAVEGTLGALHDLYLCDVVGVDEREVVLAAHIAVNALAIDKYQDIVVAQTVQLHLGTHIALVEGKRGGQSGEDILQALAAILAQHLARDDLRLNRRILQQMAGASTCHHHLLQAVRTPDIRLGIGADSQQHQANSQCLSSHHNAFFFRTVYSCTAFYCRLDLSVEPCLVSAESEQALFCSRLRQVF